MIREKCQCCHDEVLILKQIDGKRVCLDCFYEKKDEKTMGIEVDSEKKEINTDQNKTPSSDKHQGDRRCPCCGMVIPFDSIICCYCGKKFGSFL